MEEDSCSEGVSVEDEHAVLLEVKSRYLISSRDRFTNTGCTVWEQQNVQQNPELRRAYEETRRNASNLLDVQTEFVEML